MGESRSAHVGVQILYTQEWDLWWALAVMVFGLAGGRFFNIKADCRIFVWHAVYFRSKISHNEIYKLR
jgi:hypothetical protein